MTKQGLDEVDDLMQKLVSKLQLLGGDLESLLYDIFCESGEEC